MPALCLATGSGGAHRSADDTAPARRSRVAFTAAASTLLALGGPAAVSQVVHNPDLLRVGFDGVHGTGSPAVTEPDPVAAVQPVPSAVPVPAAADAAALVKAAGLTALNPTVRPTPSAAPPVSARPARPAGAFVRPVDGVVTSGFGLRDGALHAGLDIANKIGTPIHAVAAGEVVEAGPASGFGLWVRLRHADGTITVYGHVNRIFVKQGQHVDAGFVIAEVGNRGQSTGPHLHIEVWAPSGKKINPRPWLAARGIAY